MSFCQQNVPKADTWQHTLRTKSARVVQIAGVRKRKGCNVFCVRRVRIAPCLLHRGWGGNMRISDENGLQDMKKKINKSSFPLFFVIFVHLNTVHDEK